MFYGLASGAVETNGLQIDQVLADIETLNRAAFEGRYEVTAVSFHAYAHLADKYALLPHGASMGDRYGPIVVARPFDAEGKRPAIKGTRIAIPGTLTTAYLTLRLYEPDEGLVKIVDLGEWWAERTGGLPLPLGGNIIRRDLGRETMGQVSRLLRASISHALTHRTEAVEYAQQFGRGLDRSRTDRFVGMYVNDLTLDYGPRGRAGLERLYADAYDRGLIPSRIPVEFVA
jgi:1,4-dihydroxy-6-naphthoate synthase